MSEEIKYEQKVENVQIDIETEDTISQKEKIKDEVFEKLKDQLIVEARLIKRFYQFCKEYNEFEYDEQGLNMEESDDILRKANKIRDKFLTSIEQNLLFVFENIQTNSLTSMITFDLDTREFQYKVIIEVEENSFNLEVL